MGPDNSPPMALTVENGAQDGVGKLPSRPSRADINEALDAIGNGERDNFSLIVKANNRLKRVGLSMPGIEVRWNKLRVELTTPSKPLSQVLRSGAKCSTSGKSSQAPVVLNVGSGVLSPGRMCLLLGPPGSGRTTLLKALAGQLVPPTAPAMPSCARGGTARDASSQGGRPRKAGRIRMYGSVSYNGLQADGSAFEVPRAATYVGQTENHLPELTVAETLTFAADCQGAGMLKRMHAHLQAREAEANITPDDPDFQMVMALFEGSASSSLIVEGFARMLGIDHVMDTVVGNEMIKGISGGQKRRVTCGEMAVGLAQVMMLDEISNGLDAAATLSIVKSLRNMCEHANTTMMATLLQPAPEVVACFHDVMLLAAGRVVFLGPTDQLETFFARLSLAPLPQQSMADFAQEVVASPEDQAIYRALPAPGDPPAPWAGRKWLSPKRIQQAFEASEYGSAAANAVAAQPYSHPLQHFVLHKERYGTSTLGMWLTVMKRELRLFLCNKNFLVAGTVQTTFVAFLVSTAFVNLKHRDFNDANLFMSVLFYSLMAIFMGGFNFAPIYCQRLAVFYKQRDHRFYSASSYAVSCVLMRMPEVVLQSICYGIMVYFSVGLTRDVGRFFIFLLNLIIAGFNGAVIFQMVASLVRNEAATQGIGAMFMMSGVLVSGFPIAPSSIPGWWIWFHWLTPMSWNLRSLLVNELTSPAWPADQDTPGKTIGQVALEMRGIQTEWKWVWAGIGYVAGLTLVQLGIQILALTYLGPLRSNNNGPEYEDEDEHDPLHRHSFTLQQNGSSHLRASNVELQPAGSAGITVNNGNGTQSNAANGVRRNGEGATILEIAVAPKTGSGGGDNTSSGDSGDVSGNGAVQTAVVNGANGAASQAATRGMNPKEGGEHDLGFKPVVLAFKDVAYFVVPQGDSKELQLLDGVSGVFRPSVLTSLMGASGAGKTTLMDVLAGRKTGGRITGTQLVNGEPKRMATFARLMGYVEQLDVHNPHTTVEEALLFSARLRVSSDLLPASEVKPFVYHMMKVVELIPLSNRIVGHPGPGGGLSTEARKRLTIAVELVANPSIVFMDEPTSGLDARAAGMVMRAVRNTVATGRTVVCTIHQPNRDIMNQFDELLLLKPGGRTIFFGSLGELQTNLVSYLSGLPGVGGYESYMNPANWMLEVTSPAAESAQGVDFADLWAKSEPARLANVLIDQHCGPAPAADSDRGSGPPPPRAAFPSPKATNGPTAGGDIEAGATTTTTALATTPTANIDDDSAVQRFAQPAVRQLWLLLERGIISQWRNAPYNNMRFAATFIIGWVLGSLYWGRGLKRGTEVAVFDIMGLIFSGAINLPMINLMMIMPEVLAQRPVFYREKASGMYRSALFAMAQGTAEMPFIFVQSVLYVVIVYCTVHFEFIWVKALWFWFYTWLGMLVASFLGTASANLTPNIPAAIALCSGFVLLWMIFCGFLISRKNMPKWYLWAYYGNPFTFIIYGCVVSQLGDLWDEVISTQGGTTSVAQYIKDMMVYDYDFRGWIVLILLGFVVVFRIASYYGLMRLNYQNR